MKGLLITLLIVLVCLYIGAGQDCIVVEADEPATFDVSWCSDPVKVILPEPVGYCANARCRSSHKAHVERENVTIGMFELVRPIVIVFLHIASYIISFHCYLLTANCRSAQSEEKVVYGLTAKCPDGTTATMDVRYTNIKSCECVKSIL